MVRGVPYYGRNCMMKYISTTELITLKNALLKQLMIKLLYNYKTAAVECSQIISQFESMLK